MNSILNSIEKKASLTIWYVLDFINLKPWACLMLCWSHFVDFIWVWIFFYLRLYHLIGSGNAPLFMCDVPWPVCVPIAYNVIYVSQSTHITFVQCTVGKTCVANKRLWRRFVVFAASMGYMIEAYGNCTFKLIYEWENTSIYESTCIWFVRSKQRVKPHKSVRSIMLIEMLLILHESGKDFFLSLIPCLMCVVVCIQILMHET